MRDPVKAQTRPVVQRGVQVLADLRRHKERDILFGKTQYQRR